MKYFTVLNILFIISKVILEMWSRFNDKAPHTPPPPLFLFNLHKMFFLSNKSKCYKYYLMLSCITKTNYLPIPIQSKTHLGDEKKKKAKKKTLDMKLNHQGWHKVFCHQEEALLEHVLLNFPCENFIGFTLKMQINGLSTNINLAAPQQNSKTLFSM